jgi:CHAT domain-containing protein
MTELMQVESELAVAEAGRSDVPVTGPGSDAVSNLIAERVQLQLAFERAARSDDGRSDVHVPVGIAHLQKRLEALDATFHHYFWARSIPGGERRLHAIVVSPDSLHMLPLGTSVELDPAIAAFMDAIGDRNRARVEDASRQLSSLLLTPLLPLTTTPVLVISPDDGLYNVPFELLSYESGKPFSHLIERHAIVYAHAAGRLANLTDWQVMDQGASMQLFDVPFTDSDGSRRTGPESLPGAAREARVLERLMRTRPDIQVRRTSNVEKAQFLRSASRPTDIVHLATHSRFDPLTPHGSGILFKPENGSPTSGVLSPAEMASQSLPIRLLVLSSCESARRTGGLSAAFDFSIALSMSGVEQALVSNWAVDDSATTEFMVRFYTYMLAGESPPIALQRTKLSFAQESTLLADPSIWAAFVVTIV